MSWMLLKKKKRKKKTVSNKNTHFKQKVNTVPLFMFNSCFLLKSAIFNFLVPYARAKTKL